MISKHLDLVYVLQINTMYSIISIEKTQIKNTGILTSFSYIERGCSHLKEFSEGVEPPVFLTKLNYLQDVGSNEN